MADATQSIDPFFNVRKGGPKEKRLKRIELMGEHQPKPIYYVKAVQGLDDELLSDSTLRNYFETRIGRIGDLYRPVDSASFPKEFALVGFYDPAQAQAALQLVSREGAIDGIPVSAEEAKPWLLELYPKH